MLGKKIIAILGVCLGLLMLSSCTYLENQHKLFEQTNQCVSYCSQHYHQCKQTCDDNENICQMKNEARAAVHFERYQMQQQVKGQVVMEEEQAFQDPLACMKVTCDCDQDKMMCQQACRGTIFKKMQYVMQLN